MSWLGGGLNSLTDHISSFTKEVLTEGREEISDHTTELRIAQQKIQELEQQCSLQRQEVERLTAINSELESRCHASELQMSAVSSEYRALVQQKNEEIRSLRQSQQEELESSASWSPGVESGSSADRASYGFLGDDADFGDLISSQHEINRLAAEVRKLRSERDKWRERAKRQQTEQDGKRLSNEQLAEHIPEDYEHLKAREQELQNEVKRLVDEHQQQLAVLQSHHSQKLSDLQKNYQSEVKRLQERLSVLENGSLEGNEMDSDVQIKTLQSQLREAQEKERDQAKQLAQLGGQLREKDRAIQLLSRQMEKLQTDKIMLEKGLERPFIIEQDQNSSKDENSLKQELEECKKELMLSKEKLREHECTIARFTVDNDAEVLRKKLEDSEKVVEELRNKIEQNNTAEILEDIQVARKRVSFAANERHAFHLHEKQEIISKMVEISEQKSKLKKLLSQLNEESCSISSEIVKLVQSLGNVEHQEMVAGFINTIQLENKVLKTRNEELESVLGIVQEKFSASDSLQSPRLTAAENPEQAAESGDQHSWHSLLASIPKDLRNLKQGSFSGDQEDLESIGSSVVSELSMRNRELDEQVQLLQHQVETYERDIEHFELVKADWEAERSAMEEVLLKLRAQLRQKEESLSVVTAKRGLMEVKKQGPLLEPLEEVTISEECSGGASTEGDFDLERLQEQIEEMTQGNAQLENERDVLRAEKQGLLRELMNLRQLTQSLQEKVEKLERMNNAETSSAGGTTFKSKGALQDEITALQEEKNILEQNLIELDQQHQEAMDKVLEIKKQLEDDKKNLQDKVHHLEEKLATVDHENLLLKVETETLREQLDQLIPSLREGRIGKLDTDADLPPTEADGIDDDDDDNDDIRKEVLKSMMQAVHTLNTDNLSLEEDLTALQEERKQLEMRISQLEREREELALQNEELQREVTTLQECSQLMEELHEENKKLDEFLKQKTTKLEEEEMKIAELLKKVEALEVLQKDLSEEKDAAWRKVEECLIENDNIKSEFVELNSRLSLQEREIDALKKELDKCKQDNKALQRLLKTSEEKIGMLVACSASEDADRQALKKQLEEMEASLKKYEEEKALLHSKCSSRDLEISELKERIMQIEKEKEEKENLLSTYEHDIASLKSKMKIKDAQQSHMSSQTMHDIKEESSQTVDCAKYDSICQTSDTSKADVHCQTDEIVEDKTANNHQILEEESSKYEKLNDVANRAEQLGLKVGELSTQLEEKDKLITMKEEEVRKCNEIIKKLEADKINSNIIQKAFVSTATQHTMLSEKEMDNLQDTSLTKKAEVLLGRRNSETSSVSSEIIDKDDNRVSSLLDKVHQLEMEKEQMMLVMNEKSRECSSLKTEVLRLANIVSAEKQALAKLQQDNQELMQRCEPPPDQSMTKEAVQNLSCIIRDKDLEIEALNQKISTLLAVLQQSSSEGSKIEELLTEREKLMKELGAYKMDREKIIVALHHKHHESLRYHQEMQRLQGILASESLKYDALNQEHRNVSQQFEEKQKSLMNTQNELISLKQRVSELERQHSELCQKYDQVLHNQNSNNMVTVESQEWSSKLQQIEQLKETAADGEKLLFEKDQIVHQLSQEIQRLKSDIEQKEASIKGLQRQIENLNSKLNLTSGETVVAQKDVAELQKHLNNAKSEVLVVNESNKRLTMVVQEKEFEVKALQDKVATLTSLLQEKSLTSSSNAEVERLIAESEAMQKKAQQFQHERDELMLALSQRQQENQEMQAQFNQAQEKEHRLIKEVERLRAHLLQVEDTYTREVLAAEEREKELRNRLAQTEEKIQLSSSALQNASQRNTMQVESLQEQLRLLIQQRDEAQAQVSHLEDRVQQHASSIYNLQLVIEQYQKERERELLEVKKQHENELIAEKSKTQNLLMQLQRHEEQMAQTSEALDAASRLSEQLDRKEEIIRELREEVSHKETAAQKLKQEIDNLKSSTEGKVDKQIMKNLVLGYFSSPPGQRPEVIRLLAKILDFNQDEMSKAGIKIGKDSRDNTQALANSKVNPTGWISSILGRSPNSAAASPRTPPPSQSPSASSARSRAAGDQSTTPDITSQSFSSLFVQFLQNESQPPPKIRLPVEEMAQAELTRKRSLPSRTNPFLTPDKTRDNIDHPNNYVSTTRSGSFGGQVPALLQPTHPLMCPLSDTLPTFAPVPVKQTNNGPGASSASFLQEVLK